MRKVTWRLIPLIFLLYMLNILDRINIGFAKLQMLNDLDLSETVYAQAAGVFFIGYFIFEVPSNLMLRRVGARRWIARILMSWGLISAATMFVTGPWSFYLLRFLLGLAEAGFFPGIILYLSEWFPARERARAVSRFMVASALTGALGGPLSGSIMQFTKGTAGLTGWQWLFLLEGLPTVVMGFVVLRYLTDRPAQAHWLTPDERDWLVERMRQEEQHRETRHGLSLMQAFSAPRVWLLCAIYFTVSMGANSYGFYHPTVIKNHFPNIGESQIGLLAAIPSLCAAVAMVLVGAHSDRTGERRWHVALPALVAAAGWVTVAQAPTPVVALVGLAMAQAGMMSMLAPFWSLPTAFLSGVGAAAGIAFINSVGNLGGYAGPNIIGPVIDATGSYAGGWYALAGALVAGAVLVLFARHDATLEKRAMGSHEGGT